jgi:hypothetical protein
VVLEVLAHAGQVALDRDAHALQMRPGADARQHQQLGRAEGAGTDEDLTTRPHQPRQPFDAVVHAHGAAAGQAQPGGLGVGDDFQVGPVEVGRQIGLGCAAALAVDLGHLVDEGTEGLGAVVVADIGQALQGRGGQEGLVDGAGAARQRDVERPAAPMQGAVAELLVVLRAAEIGQHLVIAPAGIAQAGPMVVVVAMAAHIEHGVDGAAAAQGLAARLVATAAVQARLGHGLVGVVVQARGHHGHHAGRRMDEGAAVRPAVFQQADGHIRGLAQA